MRHCAPIHARTADCPTICAKPKLRLGIRSWVMTAGCACRGGEGVFRSSNYALLGVVESNVGDGRGHESPDLPAVVEVGSARLSPPAFRITVSFSRNAWYKHISTVLCTVCAYNVQSQRNTRIAA